MSRVHRTTFQASTHWVGILTEKCEFWSSDRRSLIVLQLPIDSSVYYYLRVDLQCLYASHAKAASVRPSYQVNISNMAVWSYPWKKS